MITTKQLSHSPTEKRYPDNDTALNDICRVALLFSAVLLDSDVDFLTLPPVRSDHNNTNISKSVRGRPILLHPSRRNQPTHRYTLPCAGVRASFRQQCRLSPRTRRRVLTNYTVSTQDTPALRVLTLYTVIPCQPRTCPHSGR